MVDHWDTRPCGGTKTRVPVTLINDLYQPWSGAVILRVKCGDRVLVEKSRDAQVEPLGTAAVAFDIAWPEQTGPCVLEAEIRGAEGETVHSVRDLEIVDAKSLGLAYRKPVTASSTYMAAYKPENAVDSDPGTYWSSDFKDDAWLAVDLGAAKKISRVRIQWETAFAKSFAIEISTDGKNWTAVYKTDGGKGGVDEIKFAPTVARHVRLVCTKRGTPWGNAVCEIGVFE
jgi:hypothetical protein